jgi:hypothetical protein
MTDKVPADGLIRDDSSFLEEFLNIILTDISHSGIQRFPDLLHMKSLPDCQKGNFGWISPRFTAYDGDSLTYPLYIRFNHSNSND